MAVPLRLFRLQIRPSLPLDFECGGPTLRLILAAVDLGELIEVSVIGAKTFALAMQWYSEWNV